MIATKYRYADGKAYRPNLYVLKADKFDFRNLGGMVVTRNGKALAFAGFSGLVQEPIATIIRDAEISVWGDTPAEALAKIKPHLTR